jgi:hypothetical protein
MARQAGRGGEGRGRGEEGRGGKGRGAYLDQDRGDHTADKYVGSRLVEVTAIPRRWDRRKDNLHRATT